MNFFKRIGAAFHSRTGAYIFYSLTVLAFAMLRSAKWAYWFIAEMYPLGDKFVPTLFAVIGICAAATVAFLIMGKRIKSRALRAAHTVICVLAGIMFGYTVVLSFGLDNGFQLNSILTGISNLLSILLPIAVALALPLPFAVFRKHKNAARASLAMLAIVPAAFLVYNFVISPLVYSRMSFTPSREPEAAVAEKHSIADYKILYGKDASPAETNAAEILAGCLKQITGMDYKAEQAEPTGTKEILIGQISGLDTSGLGEEGYIIEPEGDTILISGGRPRGTLYGVFHFLENYFGFRRYTRDLYVIPEAAAEIAEVVAEKYVPPMEYRQTEWLTRVINDDYSFRVANRINDNVSSGDYPPEWGGSIGYYGPFCHTFTSWLLPANEYFEKHPEWYAYREGSGKRVPGQLCLTNPEVHNQMLLELREHLKKGNQQFDGNRFIISLTQEDNFDFCQCESCKAVDEEEGSHAGTMLRFVNSIAEAIENDYPNAIFDTFAYQYTRTPPGHVKPRDNVVVRLCSIECCFAHPLSDPNCPDNVSFASDIKKWSEVCNSLYVWDYTTNYANYNVVFPNFQVLQKNMQFFEEHNVVGIYEEGNHQSERSHSEFNQLKGYLLSRLMYHPDLDFDAEMDGFLKAYYGGGWQYMREFIDLVSKNTGKPILGTHRMLNIFISPTEKGLLDLKHSQIMYADMLWEKAVELSGDEECRQNVLRSQLSWRFWKGCNKASEFSRLQQPGKWQAANEALFNDFVDFGIELYHESWAHDAGELKKPDNWRGTPERWH